MPAEFVIPLSSKPGFTNRQQDKESYTELILFKLKSVVPGCRSKIKVRSLNIFRGARLPQQIKSDRLFAPAQLLSDTTVQGYGGTPPGCRAYSVKLHPLEWNTSRSAHGHEALKLGEMIPHVE